MPNLTLSIDEGTLKRARIKAIEQGTSVNALVRRYLEQLAGRSTDRLAVESFLSLAKGAQAGSGPGARSWTRDDIYDR